MAVGEEAVVGQSAEAVVVPPDTAPLAKQTLAYGLSGLIAPITGLITLPIFARVFTRGQYGLLELGTVTLTVAIAIADAGLTAAALRGFYDYGANEEEGRRRVLLTGFVGTTTLAVAMAGVMIAFRDDLARWLFGRPGQGTLIAVIAGSVIALAIWRYACEVMRIRLMAFGYLATTLTAATLTTAIGVGGVLILGWRVDGVFVATVIGNVVAGGIALAMVARSLAGRFSPRELRRMLAYGLPLVPVALAAWALALVDRIILSRLGSLSEVGQYAIANRLASLLVIGLSAFLFGLTPFLLSTYSQDPEKEKVARGRTLTYLTFLLSFAALVLTLFAKELIDVLAPRFNDAYKVVGPLMLGAIGYGIVSLLMTGFAIARKTGRLAVLTLAAAGLNIGLNFALIPPLGILGAGLATALGYGFLVVAYYVVSQRAYPTPYEPRKILTMLVLASVLGIVGVIPFGQEAVAVTVKLSAIAVFVAGLWLTGTMTAAEFSELRRFVRRMLPLPLLRSAI
jgi:O-antigen/teichoic acid export membrane protein